MRIDVADLEPLFDEIVHEAGRAPVCEHPANLLHQHVRMFERAANCELHELVIGHGPPDEER